MSISSIHNDAARLNLGQLSPAEAAKEAQKNAQEPKLEGGKKLMADYSAEYNTDPYKSEFYFANGEELSQVAQVLNKWDTLYRLSAAVLLDIATDLQELEVSEEMHEILLNMRHECKNKVDCLNSIMGIINRKVVGEICGLTKKRKKP